MAYPDKYCHRIVIDCLEYLGIDRIQSKLQSIILRIGDRENRTKLKEDISRHRIDPEHECSEGVESQIAKNYTGIGIKTQAEMIDSFSP